MPDPDFLGHYRIERRADGTAFALGRGAMGTTYKAFDTKLHYQVALKVINSNILGNDLVRQRFLREARAAAGLRHKNVASVFHLGDEGDTYFYAMEFIEGETVESLVNRLGRLDCATALDITLQVASALIAAHRQNLIHRDLKPANLMIVREDEDDILVKVIDFGLAKSIETGGATLTHGGFVGTPHFASPEQLQETPVDCRSDIYSLGATLWYMLAGRPLFTGGLLQVMSQHLTRPPPREQLPDVPEPLYHVLERMLAKDPSLRHQTPMLLRHDLMACRQSVPSLAAVAAEPGGTSVWSAGETSRMQAAAWDTAAAIPALPGTESNPFLTGALIAQRYRLDRCCGSSMAQPFFQARDLLTNQDVALKVLSFGAIGTAKWQDLAEAVQRVQAAPHPNLRAARSLERFEAYGLLVSEWIAGVPLVEALSAQQGTIALPGVMLMLEQLARAVDHARQHRLDRLDLAVQHIFIHFPEVGVAQISADRLRQPVDRWPPFLLKVNALLLDSVVGDETIGDLEGRTIMAKVIPPNPASGSDAATDPYLFAVGHLIYELLGGRVSSGFADAVALRGPGKLASLSERQNGLLQSVLAPGNGSRFTDARAFYEAFGANMPDTAPASGSQAAAAPAQALAARPESTFSPNDESLMSTQVSGSPADTPGAGSRGRDATPVRSTGSWKRWGWAAACLVLLAAAGWTAMQRLGPKASSAANVSHNARPAVPTASASPGAVPELSQEQQLMTLLAGGQDLENAGDLAGAIRTYVQASQRFPNFDEPKLRLNKVLDDLQGQLADEATFQRMRAPITEAADAGSGLAMMLLGNRLLQADPAESLRWYKLAAEHDRRDAMTQLGKMYWSGQGLKNGPDLAEAVSWLNKASQRGDPDAKYQLALLYASGPVQNRDLRKATELLREAADMHDGNALNMLGEFYRDGTDVPVSYKQAIAYFEEASKAGNADASANLGVSYINGNQGVDKNLRYGVELIRQAAEQNSPLGMYYYAVCFEKGIEQPNNTPNLDQAKVWYVKAAKSKYQRAMEWCDKNNVAY
jgi:TPR repeat protein/tRNA A-37 threonylcarbamoyl transferase component Bud32